MIDYQTSRLTLDVPAVRTARWVALAMLLIAALSTAALWLSWKDFKYAESTQKALTEQIQSIRQSSNAALAAVASVQQQLRQTDAKDRDLQGELKVLTNRLQLTQDDLELARRQNRLFNQTQSEVGAGVQPTIAGDGVKALLPSPKEGQTNQR